MKAILKAAVLVSGMSLALLAHAQVIDEGERGRVSPTGLISTGAAIDADGRVVVWGFRGTGQQGNGVTNVVASSAPARVQSLWNINYLATGDYHLIAMDEFGDVYGWGVNTSSQTGCSGTYVNTPCKVISSVMQIAAGANHSMALQFSGDVYVWGQNSQYQLGNGTTTNSLTPVKVNLQGERARLIGAAYNGGFAVTNSSHVWAWGTNTNSGLGMNGTAVVTTPTRVLNLEPYASRITYIAGGTDWGEALLSDGKVIGWGLRSAIGVGTMPDKTTYSPDPIEIMDNVQQLFARYEGSVALTRDGYLFTWGKNSASSLRMIYGEAPKLHFPVHAKPQVIGGGREHLLYQTADGKIWGVGYNNINKVDQSRCCSPNVDWPGVQTIF